MSIAVGVNYAKVYSLAEKNNKLEYMTRLQQAADMLTKRASEIDNMAYELSQNPRVKTLFYAKQTDLPDTILQVQEIQKDIQILGTPNNFINEVLVYSKKNNFFVSANGFYKPEIYYDSIYKYKGLSFDKWMEFINTNSTAVYMNSTVGKYGDNLVNMITYHYSFYGDNDLGSLLIYIDEDKFKDILSKVTDEGKGIYYLVDNRNSILTTNDKEHNFQTDLSGLENLKEGAGFKTIKSKDNKMMMFYFVSPYNKWKYVCMLPLNSFMSEANSVRKFTISEILICILIGLIASWLAAYKNYGYIYGIIKFIKKNYGYSKNVSNEYELISEVLKETFDEVSITREDIKRQIPVLRQNYLGKLLKDINMKEGEYLDSNKYLDLDFSNMDLSTVILFRIKEFNNILQSNNTERGLVRFGMINILEEMSNNIAKGFALEMEEDLVALIIGVNLKNKDGFNGKVIQLVQNFREFLKEKMNIDIYVGVGDICENFMEINKAYDSSKQALDYTLLYNDDVVFYSDLAKKSEKTYNIPIDKELQIINLVKAGKNEQAVGILEYLYNENLINGELSSQMARNFIYFVYNMIIRILNEIKVDENHPIFKKILNEDIQLQSKNIEEIFSDFSQIINEICDLINSRKKCRNLELKEKIISYIDDNYNDSGLSLEQISEYLNVSSQYLSKYFKESIGCNYVEYINMKRIESAKILLKLNEYKVKDVALESGFDNIGTFINVFKKYEGMTPGKFKEKECN